MLFGHPFLWVIRTNGEGALAAYRPLTRNVQPLVLSTCCCTITTVRIKQRAHESKKLGAIVAIKQHAPNTFLK